MGITIPIFNNKYQTGTNTDFSRITNKYRLMLINTNYRLNKLVYVDKLYQNTDYLIWNHTDTDMVRGVGGCKKDIRKEEQTMS